MLIDRGEHVLSELVLLQRARCERSERAYVARMDQLQQRCKQQQPLRSHRSTVQLEAGRHDVWHGDMAWTAQTAVPLRGRLKVLFANAFEFEVEQGTVGMLGTSSTRSARRRCRA